MRTPDPTETRVTSGRVLIDVLLDRSYDEAVVGNVDEDGFYIVEYSRRGIQRWDRLPATTWQEVFATVPADVEIFGSAYAVKHLRTHTEARRHLRVGRCEYTPSGEAVIYNGMEMPRPVHPHSEPRPSKKRVTRQVASPRQGFPTGTPAPAPAAKPDYFEPPAIPGFPRSPELYRRPACRRSARNASFDQE